jgi:hypothetical protein
MPEKNERNERCYTCGHKVYSVFDHVDIDCEHDMTEEEIRKLEEESDATPPHQP